MIESPVRLARVRQFNKRVTNRLANQIAGRYVYSLVQHTGRRSGAAYSTPVVAEPAYSGFLLPLPYGDDTDWCKNVFAAGGCTLVWRRQTYRLCAPQVVGAGAGLVAFTMAVRLALLLSGVRQYLYLRRSDTAASA